ncbi:PilW family protein [Janthinobacterium fluminis]|uniref:PilW family protein n=1 Tax=Janthinobacterium fluminis TaxID=2987524 RepID=A0ABT5K703_9BURK|nr:PilW family protein [Janthinobacterium fluminis]MDC8760566.1 PilW family protein [Janthinobacterium fluminis]
MKPSAALTLARARGFGAAELLVALALGLVVALAGSALLLASNASYLSQTEAARLDDNARYALDLIGRAVRQTAFVDLDSDDAPVGARPEDSASVGGLDARSVNRSSFGIEAPAAAVNGSDVLALRYFGAGSGSGGDGSVINCAGFGVGAAHSEAERGWSIFYVARDATGEAELRCKYRGESSWGADAIVRGVDTFQVLYGLDTDEPPDGVANAYLNASAIDGLDGALPLTGADAAARAREKNAKTCWKRVVSVRVALLLHGERATQPPGGPAQFDLFGKAYSDAHGGDDAGARIDAGRLPAALRGRARRALVTTILLRNRPA